MARVIFGPDGTLYGTTYNGGGSGCYQGLGCGTVFRLRPQPTACASALCPWTETVLYRFTGGTDGGNPGIADLIFDKAGNLYGTTSDGGIAGCNAIGCGVVYELTPSNGGWTESVLYRFTGGNDGSHPGGGVTFDQSGNLYGVAAGGGSAGRGTVYELTPSGSGWVENTIYSFGTGASGRSPLGSPIFDGSGNLDLATAQDTLDEDGTVYQLTKSNNTWSLGKLAVLSHQFVSGGVVLDATGNVYDTALGDGRNTYGTIFKLTSSFSEVVLHSFTSDCSNGCARKEAWHSIVTAISTAQHRTADQATMVLFGRSRRKTVVSCPRFESAAPGYHRQNADTHRGNAPRPVRHKQRICWCSSPNHLI